MGTVTKLNNVLCANISKVDSILKANASKWDDNTFCPVSPTPTPTPSPAVNCVDGETTNGGFYSFYDCCGVYFEGSGELPFVACYDANKLNTGISFGDPCSYSCVTPTPTITPTPTPTPTPCELDCCPIELCYSERDCTDSCICNNPEIFYIHKCAGEACDLPFAFGIYKNELCTDVANSGYYSQSGGKCYEWDGTTLVDNGPC
jgi:hypothetical protein